MLNFFAPAVGIGTLAPLMAKLLWRRSLTSVSWRSLSLWTTGASALGLVAGLLVFGRDGRVSAYALAVASGALGLGWAGFRRRH